MDHDALLALARQHPQWWHDADGEIGVEPLGRGESFTAHLLRRGAEELVLRIPHKARAELPQSLTAEHDVLRRVPDGLAARPITVHEPDHEGAPAYVVTTRVPGRVLPAAAWCDGTLLASLADSLAHLHHGGDRRGLTAPERIDPVGDAEAARAWWRENESGAAAVLAPLWPVVRLHQERTRTAFAQVSPVLLHGDPAAANLLVDTDGTVRFVDWEWAQLGDPARDLAVIGGQISAEPWYAALTGAQLRDQTVHYLQERARLSGERPEKPGRVLERRRAHLVHEAFFVAAHLHRTGQEERSAALLDQLAAVVR